MAEWPANPCFILKMIGDSTGLFAGDGRWRLGMVMSGLAGSPRAAVAIVLSVYFAALPQPARRAAARLAPPGARAGAFVLRHAHAALAYLASSTSRRRIRNRCRSIAV